MNDKIKLYLLFGIGRPIAAIAGFGLGYGLGKLVYCVYDKIETYCYYHTRTRI